MKDSKCQGIILKDGSHLTADAVILTTGTFLGGRVHIGNESQEAGRFMRNDKRIVKDFEEDVLEPPSNDMARSIRALGFAVDRQRTGTPPRLKWSSIDFTGMEEQVTDDPPSLFSYVHEFEDFKPFNEMIKCYIARTNDETHALVLKNMDNLPKLYGNEGKVV